MAASFYALIKGGGPERIGGALLLLANVLTRALQDIGPARYVQPQFGVLVVDLFLLLALVALALEADRYWPLWIAALHALGTAAHIAKAIDPMVLSLAYAILTKAWAYPITAILIVATIRHRRRIIQTGSDPDWSFRSAI